MSPLDPFIVVVILALLGVYFWAKWLKSRTKGGRFSEFDKGKAGESETTAAIDVEQSESLDSEKNSGFETIAAALRSVVSEVTTVSELQAKVQRLEETVARLTRGSSNRAPFSKTEPNGDIEVLTALRSVVSEVTEVSELRAKLIQLEETVARTESRQLSALLEAESDSGIEAMTNALRSVVSDTGEVSGLRAKLRQLEMSVTNLADRADKRERSSLTSEVSQLAEQRTKLRKLEEIVGTSDDRLGASQSMLEQLSTEKISRTELDSTLRRWSLEERKRLSADLQQQLDRGKESEVVSASDWPPSWFNELAGKVGEDENLSRLKPLCLSLAYLDKGRLRFRVLAELWGTQIGAYFSRSAKSLSRETKSRIIRNLNLWLRSVEYPFDVFYPIEGDGFDPELHSREDAVGEVAAGSRVVDVICWGLRERGGRARVVAKAAVAVR